MKNILLISSALCLFPAYGTTVTPTTTSNQPTTSVVATTETEESTPPISTTASDHIDTADTPTATAAPIPISTGALTNAATHHETTSPSSTATDHPSSANTIGTDHTPTKTSFSSQQLNELKEHVRNILKENPDIVINAIQDFSEKQQLEQQKKSHKLITDHKDALLDHGSASMIGNPNGHTKLIVFLDPNCPHCREFEKILHVAITKLPDLSVYFRHWAILGDDSTEVVKGIVAAQLQDKAKAISDKIANAEDRLNLEKFTKIAKECGVDIEQMKKDMVGEKVRKIIEHNKVLAEKLGLQGTPTSILAKDGQIQMISPTDEKSLMDDITGPTSSSELAIDAPILEKMEESLLQKKDE